MNKKSLSLLIVLGMLACKALTPEPQEVPPVPQVPTVDVVSETTPQPTPETVTEPSPEPPAATGFTIVRLRPEDGDLADMLAEEAQKSVDLGLIPIVEFDATWCPPCIAIDAAIEAEDELMVNAYAGTYIIKLDVDEWGWDNGEIEFFQFEYIPVYFKIDEAGNPTGEMIDGGAWNEDIPENIAPVMDEFFHGSS